MGLDNLKKARYNPLPSQKPFQASPLNPNGLKAHTKGSESFVRSKIFSVSLALLVSQPLSFYSPKTNSS